MASNRNKGVVTALGSSGRTFLHVDNGKLGGYDLDRAIYPRFCALIEARQAILDGTEAIGFAADGIEVSFAELDPSIESYLSAHPTPDTW